MEFAFNKLAFVEMDRRNILLNRRPTSESHQNQCNSSFLSSFLKSTTKSKGSISKCLFGRPDGGDTQRLMKQMQEQERTRARILYQFDIVTNQPVNLTPPASPYIGERSQSSSRNVNNFVDRVRESELVQVENQSNCSDDKETVIVNEKKEVEEKSENDGGDDESQFLTSSSIGITNRTSLKRRSSERDQEEEEDDSRQECFDSQGEFVVKRHFM